MPAFGSRLTFVSASFPNPSRRPCPWLNAVYGPRLAAGNDGSEACGATATHHRDLCRTSSSGRIYCSRSYFRRSTSSCHQACGSSSCCQIHCSCDGCVRRAGPSDRVHSTRNAAVPQILKETAEMIQFVSQEHLQQVTVKQIFDFPFL